MAIAISSTGEASSSGSVNQLTYPGGFNNVAGNFMFVTFCEDTGSPSQTGVTYGGVAMDPLTTISAPFANNVIGWILKNPATGTNALIATRSTTSTAVIRLCVATYSGTDTVSQPDSQSTYDVTGSTGSATTTVVASNCWLIMSYENDAGTGNNVSAGASTTLRIANSGNGAIAILDSNATVGTGAQSLNYSTSVSHRHFGNIISIQPSTAAGPANLKSLNTNLKANIKSINTNLIANVKSVNTNT